VISVAGLSKSFHEKKRGTVRAVDEVSFEVKPGQVFGLLGLNGAGKTTTLRLLATMLKPDAGTARVAGYDLLEQPDEVRRRIGFLTGNTGLYLRLTGRETLQYFGGLQGLTKKVVDERIERFAQLLDMPSFLDVRVDKYSTGMKQKVSIARTLIHDPPVLILDEPTLGLDVLTSRSIVEFIRTAKADGKAVIFSTHIMWEAARLCDYIGVVHEGRMKKLATLEDLKRTYGTDDLDGIFVRIIEEQGK
jgi:sodium transport system ATP-binding protein